MSRCKLVERPPRLLPLVMLSRKPVLRSSTSARCTVREPCPVSCARVFTDGQLIPVVLLARLASIIAAHLAGPVSLASRIAFSNLKRSKPVDLALPFNVSLLRIRPPAGSAVFQPPRPITSTAGGLFCQLRGGRLHRASRQPIIQRLAGIGHFVTELDKCRSAPFRAPVRHGAVRRESPQHGIACHVDFRFVKHCLSPFCEDRQRATICGNVEGVY